MSSIAIWFRKPLWRSCAGVDAKANKYVLDITAIVSIVLLVIMSDTETRTGSEQAFTAVALVTAAYIAAQILSDVASLRIIFLFGFSIDAGTLIYPFTFTLRDLVHKTAGIKTARRVIVAAGVINLFMAGLFWLVARLPPDKSVGPQLEFGMVLSPVWRIVIASIIAEVASELVDGEIYQLWVNRVGYRLQWMRVLTSNSVSVPLDSALFCSLAFIGRMPFLTVLSIFWANVILKGITTLISLPMIYLVRERKFSLQKQG